MTQQSLDALHVQPAADPSLIRSSLDVQDLVNQTESIVAAELAPAEQAYSSEIEASRHIEAGRAAITRGDGAALRAAVRGLWNLQPKDAKEASRERGIRSGLREI